MIPFKLNRLADVTSRSAVELPRVEMGTSIPHTIVQTSRARPWHPLIEENVEHLKTINPGWEHRFFDDDAQQRFVAENYSEDVLRLYERIRPEYGAARADLFRYLFIYREGGVYLDMKSRTTRPLDDVIRPDDVFLLSRWKNGPGEPYEGWGRHSEVRHLGGEYQQWFIAAAKGHPFLRRIIQLVLANIDRYVMGLHGTGAYAVLRVTGPVPYTLGIASLLAQAPHRLVDSADDLGLIYSVFDAGSARSHEAILPHYAKLATPLIDMQGWNVGASQIAGGAKSALRRLRSARGKR